MKIPITMCHGIRNEGTNPLTVKHLETLISIAFEMEFNSITYDDLDSWFNDDISLPNNPIMFDFDHPMKNILDEVNPILSNYGYTGNLFMYTKPYDARYPKDLPWKTKEPHLSWNELRQLKDLGWNIGAHTISHPNLSDLSIKDPTGEQLRREIERSNQTIKDNLGFYPKDFAFTGTSWSSNAEIEIKKHYRFGRLWITGPNYNVDGNNVRYADLVGINGADELDGGPPYEARYITESTDRYKIPSMELQALIYKPLNFRRYIEMAAEENNTSS